MLPNIEVVELHSGDLLSLEEFTVVFNIVHLETLINWVVKDSVVSLQFSLLVVPLAVENVSLFSNNI